MDDRQAEKYLYRLFSLILVLSLICSISTGIAWYHWKDVLDVCGTYQGRYGQYEDPKCGCILHAYSTATYFTGGHLALCGWVTYGPLVPAFFCFLLGSFHMYRICCGVNPRRTETRTVRNREGELTVITAKAEDAIENVSPYYWTPLGILATIMACYMLIHAAFFTDGYVRTCSQYRLEVSKYTQATGRLVEAIQGRLSCNAIFDFMDYIHPDVNYEKRRIDRINTSYALGLPLIATWVTILGWIIIAVIAFRQARATRHVRV